MSDRDAARETLNDQLAGILDDARDSHYDRASDETFTSCGLCDGWEGDHTPTCPIPAIAAWLDTQPMTPVAEETR